MSQNVKLSEEPTMEPMDSMNVKQNNKYECVFKRGGLCKTHGVMGRRNVRSIYIWDLLLMVKLNYNVNIMQLIVHY